jgi:hypothetical protein
VKKVRLHLPVTEDLKAELRNHKVFREVRALSSSSCLSLSHTVRYYNCWFEDLTEKEVCDQNE